jgi:UDP-2,3-diacylglucosamine hydrolase
MNIVIASDFHLKFQESAADRKRRGQVIKFLDSLRGATDLLILNGDVFDLWMEWPDFVISGYFPLYESLAELSRSGCRIVLIPGNHDFLFERFMTTKLGVEIVGDAFTGEFDGKRLYVAHGDTYTTNDLRYQVYRRLVRSALARWVIRNVPPAMALSLGARFSRTSRRARIPREAHLRKEAGLLRKARKLAAKHDIIVFGHTHIPRAIPLGKALYFNSGDWVEHRTFVLVVDGVAEIHEYMP